MLISVKDGMSRIMSLKQDAEAENPLDMMRGREVQSEGAGCTGVQVLVLDTADFALILALHFVSHVPLKLISESRGRSSP